MKAADGPAVPAEISYPEAKIVASNRTLRAHRFGGYRAEAHSPLADEAKDLTQRKGWERFEKHHKKSVWRNMIPITLFNVLAASFWLALSVLALSVAFLYLGLH